MENAKEEIRARLPIEDVVGQYIELKRSGSGFKGHSPWGTDRTPSFMVSPDKGIWHDFSSNKGGDIFSFVMEMEGCNFREALEKLAQQAGVELKRYSEGDRKFAAKKQRCFDALEAATKYYENCLRRSKFAIKYVFYKRNLNKKTVEKFRIGYAPTSQAGMSVVEYLAKSGFSKEEMLDAGLLNRRGTDLFRGRMMVPLMDEGGRVIGFTGRKLDETDTNSPKYLNTPETILYNKSRHIFGLSQARDTIRRSEYLVVVEGNMDVISSHQAGVCQAVATAGTAMTELHLKSFSRMTKDIRLAYDGDEAGVRAAERAISMASKFGIYLSIVDNYHGCKDADELIQKDPELWQQAVQEYRPALEWLFDKYETKYDLKTEKGFQEYCNEAKRLISQIDENETALKERYERIVCEKLGISLESFRAKKVVQERKKLKKPAIVKNTTNSDGVVENTTPEISRAEKNLAALVTCGGVKNEEIELAEIPKGELELIFEAQYANWAQGALEQEAEAMMTVVRKERADAERKNLELQIKAAEEAGDNEKMLALMAEVNKMLRKS